MAYVNFVKSKTLSLSLTDSSSNPGKIYFPTDDTCIVMGSKKYGIGSNSSDFKISGTLNLSGTGSVLSGALADLKNTGDIAFYLIADSQGRLPSTETDYGVPAEVIKQLSCSSPNSATNLILNAVPISKFEEIAVNVGDIIALTRIKVAASDLLAALGVSLSLSGTIEIYQYKIISTNDAKAPRDGSPGVMGLMTPSDKSNLNSALSTAQTAYSVANSANTKINSRIPYFKGSFNSGNDCDAVGVYDEVTLGRPANSLDGETYLLTTYPNGHQVAISKLNGTQYYRTSKASSWLFSDILDVSVLFWDNQSGNFSPYFKLRDLRTKRLKATVFDSKDSGSFIQNPNRFADVTYTEWYDDNDHFGLYIDQFRMNGSSDDGEMHRYWAMLEKSTLKLIKTGSQLIGDNRVDSVNSHYKPVTATRTFSAPAEQMIGTINTDAAGHITSVNTTYLKNSVIGTSTNSAIRSGLIGTTSSLATYWVKLAELSITPGANADCGLAIRLTEFYNVPSTTTVYVNLRTGSDTTEWGTINIYCNNRIGADNSPLSPENIRLYTEGTNAELWVNLTILHQYIHYTVLEEGSRFEKGAKWKLYSGTITTALTPTLANYKTAAHREYVTNADLHYSPTTNTSSTLTAGTGKYISSINRDAKGHVTGISTGTLSSSSNAFSNITVGTTTISADSTTDTLTLTAGSNITLTPDATNDKITIAAKDTTYSTATTSAAGLMSSSDKTKLDGIAAGANNYTHPTTSGNKHIPSGGSSGQILRWSADGTAVWGADNNTTYSNATTSAAGLMSAVDKTKLDGIATGANKYSLPIASSTVLGGIKVGAGLSINASTGVLSATGGGTADAVDWANVTSKPTIPTKTSQLTNDSGFLTAVSWATVTGKPTFATVATSGSYDDLTNKPTIPAAYSLPVMTNTTRGGAKLVSNTTQTVAANSVTSAANRTYAVQKNSSELLVVNVPWTSDATDIQDIDVKNFGSSSLAVATVQRQDGSSQSITVPYSSSTQAGVISSTQHLELSSMSTKLTTIHEDAPNVLVTESANQLLQISHVDGVVYLGVGTGLSVSDRTDGNAGAIITAPDAGKVTSNANHYTPAESTSSALNATSGLYITGLKRDSKGHVTGITSSSIPNASSNSSGLMSAEDYSKRLTGTFNPTTKELTLTNVFYGSSSKIPVKIIFKNATIGSSEGWTTITV